MPALDPDPDDDDIPALFPAGIPLAPGASLEDPDRSPEPGGVIPVAAGGVGALLAEASPAGAAGVAAESVAAGAAESPPPQPLIKNRSPGSTILGNSTCKSNRRAE